MEQIPKFRVVGDVSEDIKTQAANFRLKRLFDHLKSLPKKEREELERVEYPKSEKEIILINFANEETNRLMVEAGVEPYDVPLENFHIVPTETYKKASGGNSDASTNLVQQGIVFDAKSFRGQTVFFGAVILHELLHLKGHLTMEVEDKPGGGHETTNYREGVATKAAQKLGLHGKYHMHFSGLHEAIVSEQESRSYKSILALPVLNEERVWLQSDEVDKIKSDISEKKEIPKSDILWVDKNGKDYESISYLSPRMVLRYVCEEISKTHPERFSSPDDVFKIFINAQFSGKLLEIGRMVEEVFGKWGFRLLGDMTTSRESANACLEALKKNRLRVKKNINDK